MISAPASPATSMRPIGPGSPMRSGPPPRARLAGGQSDRSGRWHSRVWMTGRPARRKPSMQPLGRRDAGRELRDVVAERGAEAARLEEVALHVDHHQRDARLRQFVGVRSGGGDGRHAALLQCPAMARPIAVRSAAGGGRLQHDAAVRHDQQAVGEVEQFVEILADQQHRRAAVARGDDLAVDVGDRGEVETEAPDWRRPEYAPRRRARAPAPRAGRCRRTARRSARRARAS